MNESDIWNNLDTFVEQQSEEKDVGKIKELIDHTTESEDGKTNNGIEKSKKTPHGYEKLKCIYRL